MDSPCLSGEGKKSTDGVEDGCCNQEVRLIEHLIIVMNTSVLETLV